MKVDLKNNYTQQRFGQLEPGDTFIHEGTAYMKTLQTGSSPRAYATNLDTGLSFDLAGVTPVERRPMKVVDDE